jgi:putative FmdB family regulatory protein
MPTYEYHCTKCGHNFEAFQSIKAQPLSECPVCHQSALQRIISGGTGLIFKGAGFYITDYARKSSTTSSTNTETKQETTRQSKTVTTGKTPEPVKP